MADSATCTPTKHVLPILQGKFSATVTPPWFVDCSEYTPKMATFKPLVNGEEAFGEVYRAIAAAKKSVCIICWGFQPSMYFIRDGRHLMIGELLEKKARQGVMVRVLCWAFQFSSVDRVNVTGIPLGLNESNTPGRWVGLYDRPDSSSNAQHAFDERWYNVYDRKQSLAGELGRKYVIRDDYPKDKLLFTSRTYTSADKQRIERMDFLDAGVTDKTVSTLKGYPSHHQKTVIVDPELPDKAVGFVMGHNMLDGYWDTSTHSAQTAAPNAGRNVGRPLHDYSSRVSGPLVGDVFRNFAHAWKLETGDALAIPPFETHPITAQDPRAVCQILRTQPQHGRQDIQTCYLQATANATQYIHIENQYFRWPPLAEKIKESAARLAQWGRTPEKHGSLYLFVITNSTDAGMGVGSVNTYRMLDSLGRADRIPEVARDQRLAEVDAQRAANEAQMAQLRSRRLALDNQQPASQGGSSATARTGQYAALDEQASRLQARQRELDEARTRLEPKSIRERLTGSDRTPEAIQQANIPGLKVHVATLVAPDTPAGKEWQEVYIHAKLMLIDDTFMTLGSANINTRSMQTDSEMNIAHHRPEITRPLREEQWARYTGGRVAAGMALADEYREWQNVMNDNAVAKGKAKGRPIAQLAEFLRTSDKISNLD